MAGKITYTSAQVNIYIYIYIYDLMVKHAWFLGLTDFSGYWVSTDTSSLGPSQICVTVVTTERSSHIPDGLSSV